MRDETLKKVWKSLYKHPDRTRIEAYFTVRLIFLLRQLDISTYTFTDEKFNECIKRLYDNRII